MDFLKAKASAVVGLPDDPLLEILSRVPFRSMCRFKYVSKAWRDLVVDPLHRSKLPQTLEGLFHEVHRRHDGSANNSGRRNRRHGCVGFFGLSGRSVALVDPFFSFLRKMPGSDDIRLLDTSHGLLLLERGYSSDTPSYIVCNPVTEQWMAVPEPDRTVSPYNGVSIYLIYSPAVSCHFDLVQFEGDISTGVTSVHIPIRRKLVHGLTVKVPGP